MAEMKPAGIAMAARVLGDVPIIADADTEYGPPMSVARTVRAYEQAGAAAIQLEDQAFPSAAITCPARELVSIEESLAGLGAAPTRGPDAVIIARTDAQAVLGLDAAIERGNAYAAAGADLIFVEAPRTRRGDGGHRPRDQLRCQAHQHRRQAALLLEVEGAALPKLQLRAVAIYPTTALLAATGAVIDALSGIGAAGRHGA